MDTHKMADKAKHAAEHAKETAGKMADHAKEATKDMAGKVADKAHDMAKDAKSALHK